MNIVVRPRLHLGLISMHNGGVRKNGGIGFAVDEPRGIIRVSESEQSSVEDRREFPFGNTEIEQLHHMVQTVSKTYSLQARISVTLTGNIRTHVGMGSGTAIRLGVLEGLFRVNRKEVSTRELVHASNRGGTSGVGINTYFSGGLILDVGIPNDHANFKPSSRAINPVVPSSLPGLFMADWPLCLCVPRTIHTKSQKEEMEFFSRTAPVPESDSFLAAYEALFGVYAATIENDFIAFCAAIRRFQETNWKLKEWAEYGFKLSELSDNLYELGASAVGMSSLGPMLYCFGDEAALERILQSNGRLECDIWKSRPHNSGRDVS